MNAKPPILHYIIMCVLLLGGVIFSMQSCHRAELANERSVRLQMELTHEKYKAKTERDKFNRETAYVTAIRSSRDELLAVVAEQGTALAQLQQLVKETGKKTTSAIVAATVTQGRATGNTVVQLPPADTANPCPLPVYTSTVTDSTQRPDGSYTRWFTGTIRATPESTTIDYQVHNQFSIWQTDKRSHWLKPSEPVVHFRNENPRTTTTELQTWNVATKPAKRGLWMVGGVAVGASIMPLLKIFTPL